MTASVFTIPYHEMGERIKPGTLTLQSYVTGSTTNISNASFNITSSDDGSGNLRDISYNTSSYASSSRLEMYFSFNDEYRKFEDNRILGTISDQKPIKYYLRGTDSTAVTSNVKIETGVNVFVSNSIYTPSGLSGFFTGSNASYVQLRDNEIYEQTQKCDDWTLSFYIKPQDLTSSGVILSKYSNRREIYFDPRNKMQKVRICQQRS